MLQLYIKHFANGTYQLNKFKEITEDHGEILDSIISYEEVKETRLGEEIEVVHIYDDHTEIINAKLTDVNKDSNNIWYAAYMVK